MRKLASIKRIDALVPIEGKDRIVLATVDGWNVIVQKDQFSEGDLCVFCEIDSVLPEKPEFEFLRPKNFRIKTMRMAGVISQGICFPLNILPKHNYKEGDDVTKIIGITQYVPTMDIENTTQQKQNKKTKSKITKFLLRYKFFRDIMNKKKTEKGFPSFISKTDETRIQNIPFVLNNKCKFIATEKIDGQSGTFAIVRKKSIFKKRRFEYIVCSRNIRLHKPDNSTYWFVSKKYNIENKLKNMVNDFAVNWIAIQGECIAPNVQKNKYKVTEPDLYVFNLITPSGRIGSLEAKEMCEKYGFKFVPIISDNYILPDTINEVLDFAHGESKIGNTLREGIVFRSLDGKISFKAVDPLFLLKYDE